MSNDIIIPTTSSFYEWASNMSFIRPDLNFTIPPQDESNWREWASLVVFLNQPLHPLLPIPNEGIYPNDDDWRKWGSLFTYLVL